MVGRFDKSPSDAECRASGRKEALSRSVVEVSLISETDALGTRMHAVGLDATECVVESPTSLLWTAVSLLTTMGRSLSLHDGLLAHVSLRIGFSIERIAALSFRSEIDDGDETLRSVLRVSILRGIWSLVK